MSFRRGAPGAARQVQSISFSSVSEGFLRGIAGGSCKWYTFAGDVEPESFPRSDGADFRYQSAPDSGVRWRPGAEPIGSGPNGSTSFDALRAGDAVYAAHVHYPLGRCDPEAPYARDAERRGEYTAAGRVCRSWPP